ncbi:MAG: hypothetical protein QM426_01285 [Euryarchaeota archaeon]|nr:hypothetical protein [Euryarchaeota archaeon]
MPAKIAEVIQYDVCAARGACEAVCPIGAVTVKKAAEIKGIAEHFLEVCKELNFETGIRNETV